MDFKIHSYILHPQILGTDCKIYIDCENARKLKNKLEEYQNNKIWFNIKKFLRLKRYLNILNNYLFILYTKMYKNDKVFEGKQTTINTTINTQIDKLRSEIFSEEKKKIEENTGINDIVIGEKINKKKEELNKKKEELNKKKEELKLQYDSDLFHVLSDEELQKYATNEILSDPDVKSYNDKILDLENNIKNNNFKEKTEKHTTLTDLINIMPTKDYLFNNLIKIMQTGQTKQLYDENKNETNYYTEFSGVFRTLLFGDVFDFINFWAFNVYKLCDIINIIDDNNNLKNILNNYITKKQLNITESTKKQIDSIKAIYTQLKEKKKEQEEDENRIIELIKYLNNIETHIKEITEYIKKIDVIIKTDVDEIKQKIIENNNPIFDDLNDYANNGDIIEVSVYRKGLRLNYKGCITQINVNKKKFVVTYYSNFSKKLYIGEYNFATDLCIKNKTDYNNCIKFIDNTPKQISIIHDLRKFIFDTGTYNNKSDLEKYCKIFIDIDNTKKLISAMNVWVKSTKINIPNHYTIPYQKNNNDNIKIHIKNDSLLKLKQLLNSDTQGFITGFNPIKHNFSIIYYQKFRTIKFRTIKKDFNFNKLCITNDVNNNDDMNDVNNNDDMNDINKFDQILASVLKDDNEKIKNMNELITDKNKRYMLIKKIFNLIENGLFVLAIAFVIALILAMIAVIVMDPIGFIKGLFAILIMM